MSAHRYPPPPPGWAPPPGWVPPPGWAPPPGWEPPADWVPPADWPRQWLPPGWEPGKPNPRLSQQRREANSQTLLYSLGAAITLAGLVLLLGMAFELSAALLTYAFALGLGVVTLVLLWRTTARQLATPMIVISGALATISAMSSEAAGDVADWVGIGLVSLALVLAAAVIRHWQLPWAVVWLGFLVLAAQMAFMGSPAGIFAPAILLAATIGRAWGGQQVLAAVAFLLQLAIGPALFGSAVHTYLMIATSMAVGVYLVGFLRATPSPRPAAFGPANRQSRPTWIEMGAQPWPVLLLLLVGAWGAALVGNDVVTWLSLVVAGAGCLMAVALPDPPGSRQDPNAGQDLFLTASITLLALSLVLGRVDAPVEQLVLVVLAIAVQIRPLARHVAYSGVIRGIPTVLAFVATIETSIGVWGAPETVLADPTRLLAAGLLTALGVAMMVFRYGKPAPVPDAIRLLVGLYLAGYALVIGGAWLGDRLGDMEGGFLTGHALASICWMLVAAAIALRRRTNSPATDLTVAVIIAVAAAGKLILFDMQLLGGIPRVAAFLGCGVLMMGIAFLRQRRGVGQLPPPGPPPHPGPPPWYPPQGGPNAQH